MRINKNIVAKSKLLLNPLFPTLKKGIIQLFIVSLHKVPEFWCSFFFSNTKLLIFGNFYFIIEISLNSFINKLEIKDALQAIELAKAEQQEKAPNLDDLLPKNIPVASVENLAEIEKLKTKIEELNKANQEAFDIADNYKKLLKQIFSKITFMKSFISGDEICEIDMKKVDFLKLREQSGIV